MQIWRHGDIFLPMCTGPKGYLHMVKKGHKCVTLLQINVPKVMILSQKLGKFIWQEDIYLTVRDIYLTGRGIYFEKGHNFVTNY